MSSDIHIHIYIYFQVVLTSHYLRYTLHTHTHLFSWGAMFPQYIVMQSHCDYFIGIAWDLMLSWAETEAFLHQRVPCEAGAWVIGTPHCTQLLLLPWLPFSVPRASTWRAGSFLGLYTQASSTVASLLSDGLWKESLLMQQLEILRFWRYFLNTMIS